VTVVLINDTSSAVTM